MQDLQTLEEVEKIEQSLNNIDLNETIPLEANKTFKKKRVLFFNRIHKWNGII